MDVDGLKFGFTVYFSPGYETSAGKLEPAEYRAYLPHMCDEWMIASSTDKEVAVRELEKFIAEAGEALEELKKLEPPV